MGPLRVLARRGVAPDLRQSRGLIAGVSRPALRPGRRARTRGAEAGWALSQLYAVGGGSDWYLDADARVVEAGEHALFDEALERVRAGGKHRRQMSGVAMVDELE